MSLSVEALLAGGAATQVVDVPLELLQPGEDAAAAKVTVRPLTVRDLQLIAGAAREDDGLSASLMIQQALVEPALRAEQIAKMPAGLARFLVERINAISGIDTPQNALEELVQAPLAKACFVLAKEFGWTPEQVSGMTIGQILLYLEMMRGGGEAA
jgi:hypothetical protein